MSDDGVEQMQRESVVADGSKQRSLVSLSLSVQGGLRKRTTPRGP